MRALLQRVSSAVVKVEGKTVSSIKTGLLVLVGIEDVDDESDITWLCQKTASMRIFADADGRMNLSLKDFGGDALIVSQFTLHASTKKGNRPSFLKAADPAKAAPVYDTFCVAMEEALGTPVGRGIFGADMKVSLTNDGTVTIWLDSRDRE